MKNSSVQLILYGSNIIFIYIFIESTVTEADVCGTVGGMTEWQGKQKHSEKSRLELLCAQYNQHDLTQARTRAATVGSWRLTTRARARTALTSSKCSNSYKTRSLYLGYKSTANVVNSVVGRMVSSGLLRRVALVRTDVSEEPGASFIRVTKSVN
jgi:hypothetical protein